MESKRKTESFVVIGVVVLFAFSYISYSEQSDLKQSFTVGPLSTVNKEEINKHSDPFFFISSTNLEQGDTLFLKAIGVSSTTPASGEFKGKEFSFFSTGDNSLGAIIGIDAKEISGEYELVVSIEDTQILKNIKINKKNFPITELVVTSELEEKGYTPSTITATITKKDGPSVRKVVEGYTPYAYFDKPFIYPLDEITISGIFGNIRKQGYSALQHLGVDLDAEMETPIYSINDGVVAFAESLITYGNTIIVDHGLGIYSLYLHMDSFSVEVGDEVDRGDKIGFSGSSGYSILPHLHFSLKVGGASVDPLIFIKTVEKSF